MRGCRWFVPRAQLSVFAPARKPDYKVGTARVFRNQCLAWEHGEYCMVCDEFCPYKAVRSVRRGGLIAPWLIPCRFAAGRSACSASARPNPGPPLWWNAGKAHRTHSKVKGIIQQNA